MYKTVAAIFATTVYFTKDCKPLLLYTHYLRLLTIFAMFRASPRKPWQDCLSANVLRIFFRIGGRFGLFCSLSQKFWCF
jgi:hypothetical protein